MVCKYDHLEAATEITCPHSTVLIFNLFRYKNGELKGKFDMCSGHWFTMSGSLSVPIQSARHNDRFLLCICRLKWGSILKGAYSGDFGAGCCSVNTVLASAVLPNSSQYCDDRVCPTT
jgi:hypothetical protein